jgi:RNA polymerase sigma factor (sigma-70 family)
VNKYSQEEIIDGLRRRDNRVMRFVYKSNFPAVLKLVMSNSGTDDDAKDIFQESIIVAFRNIRDNNEFRIESSFNTYLYSIARLLWLQQIRNTRDTDRLLKDNMPFIDFEDPPPFNEEDLRYSLYQKAFKLMPDDCRNIIKMSNDGLTQKEIADKLGLKSENYIAKRKHFCKEFLIRKIKEDPDYNPSEL